LSNSSLWALTRASGPLVGRFILDETTRFRLETLIGGTTLGAQLDQLCGANVVLRTSRQLGTVLALLELDGVARRVVLCPPDLSSEQVRIAMATAEATAVVSDQPVPELTHTGVTCIISTSPTVTPSGSRSDTRESARHVTEWALFTSGATGPPKMALHHLRSLIGAIAIADVSPMEANRGNRVWSTFYDIRRYGGLQILLRAFAGGGSMMLSGAGEATSDFLRRAGAARVSFISGTPTHWRRALLSPAAAEIAPSNVRLSGEVADQAVLDKLHAAYPQAQVCHAFASTEAGVAFEVCDGLAGFPAEWVDQVRSCVALRVTDGTLRIRSDRTADHYLGTHTDPLKEADGFVDTKDLVELRGDRYHFMGRRDGVINVGGLKVNPQEVEQVVNRHPRVEMSLARAKQSPIIGQVVVVDVVLAGVGDCVDSKALEAEILESCRQALAWYKVPAMVRVTPSLQINATGKLVRNNR
jgi:acyl-coenzyme A synthetase/AMP-(fatty) acid ligase